MAAKKAAAKTAPAKKSAAKAVAPVASGNRQLSFFLVVDCSGSMTGDKMASLNYAVRSAIPAMRKAASDNPDNDVMVRVISFADKAGWAVEEPVPVADFTWKDLTAKGETAMGEALELLADALKPKNMGAKQIQPVIVLISDGLPTDDVDAGLAALNAVEYGKQAVRIAIAIGSDADMPTLQSFMGQSGVKPLQANNAETLVNRIKWAASVPLRAASQVVSTGVEPMQQIAENAPSDNQDGGDLVW